MDERRKSVKALDNCEVYGERTGEILGRFIKFLVLGLVKIISFTAIGLFLFISAMVGGIEKSIKNKVVDQQPTELKFRKKA